LTVVAVSTNRGTEEQVRKLVKKYVSRKRLTFLNLVDPKNSVALQYGVQGIPMSFFIDPQGKVVAFASGYREWDSKVGLLMIEQLLSTTKSLRKAK